MYMKFSAVLLVIWIPNAVTLLFVVTKKNYLPHAPSSRVYTCTCPYEVGVTIFSHSFIH